MATVNDSRSAIIEGFNHYGIKISKPGHDVNEPEKYMIMHSKYPVLKLKESGQGTVTKEIDDGGFTITIPHNLGYVPICFVSGQSFDTATEEVITRFSDWSRWIYQGLQVADTYYYYADDTNLYIVLGACYLTDAYEFDLDYMYHIFYDER